MRKESGGGGEGRRRGSGRREWSLREKEESEIKEGKDSWLERQERRESWREKRLCQRDIGNREKRSGGGGDCWENMRVKGR